MGEQDKTAEEAGRTARIDTAREGLRSALVRLAKAGHETASAKDGSGRATASGQTAPTGQ